LKRQRIGKLRRLLKIRRRIIKAHLTLYHSPSAVADGEGRK
jgi:hypothetical protein